MKKSIKRLLALFLIILTVISAAACTAPDNTAVPAVEPDPTPKSGIVSKPIKKYDEVKEITWVRVADKKLSQETLEFILLNFGLKVNEKHFTSANMNDNIVRLYTADICPDLATGISIGTAKALGEAGYLENLLTRKNELHSYFALWDDWEDGWNYTKNMVSVSDNLYCLVPVNRKASLGWIYCSSAFEEDSIRYPETLSQLYEILMRYKEKHESNYPLWINEFEALQSEAILNAYGLTSQKWQTDEKGNVFFLYSDKRWYDSLEWLIKFEKAGLVPVDENKKLKALEEKDYNNYTAKNAQIMEFTKTYNYLYVQADQKNTEWAVANVMIRANQDMEPVISSDIPYLNEAACISRSADETAKKQILAFLDWLCTDEGNLWANFGREGEGYELNNGRIKFLKYYSEELTPEIDEKETGSICDITVGRMFTTAPVYRFDTGRVNRYSAEDEFLSATSVRIKVPDVFASAESVLEDKTLLWEYERTKEKLEELAEEFEQFTRVNGCSEYFWQKYYESLVEAGLDEYTRFMQDRLR